MAGRARLLFLTHNASIQKMWRTQARSRFEYDSTQVVMLPLAGIFLSSELGNEKMSQMVDCAFFLQPF